MKKLFFLAGAVISLASIASAITLHVPADYPTIQAAINAAQDYDSVLVAAGTYFEHIAYLGKEITVKSASGPETTILDGGTPSGYVVTFSGYENLAVLEGFTITHGHTLQFPGGGVFFDTLSRATVKGNIIVDNGEYGGYMNFYGGAISAWNAAPQIEDNLIHSNTSFYYGGAICLNGCYDVVIRYNTISENFVDDGWGMAFGGGLFSLNSESLIERNLFIANDADHYLLGYGGAIAMSGSGYCNLRFNTFSGNRSGPGETGGGVCLGGSMGGYTGTLHFENNILVNSPQGGGFTFYGGNPNLHIDFNNAWNNVPFNYYGSITPGPFEISADPQFVGGSPYSYELTAASPCVDAGEFREEPDSDGTRADMGAFPYNRVGINTTFQPFTWPINIPAGGGSFAGHFYLTNNTSAPGNFDFWVDVLLPDSSVVGPLILRQNLAFSPGQQVMRISIQNVPGGAPAGNYLYRVHTGIFQTSEIFCEMNMPFVKLGSEGMDNLWSAKMDGDEAGNVVDRITALPKTMLVVISPNPFNPATTISYQLTAISPVKLTVYDTAGRPVATLVNGGREPGNHQVTFDGSNLPSGLYFYRLTAGVNSAVGKMVLLK
jgi:hypothetical protein